MMVLSGFVFKRPITLQLYIQLERHSNVPYPWNVSVIHDNFHNRDLKKKN